MDGPNGPFIGAFRSLELVESFNLKLKKAKTGSLKSAVESLDPAKNHLTIGRSKDFKNSKVFFTLYKLYSII